MRKGKKPEKIRPKLLKERKETIYGIDRKTKAKIAGKGFVLIGVLSYLFYETMYGMILLLPYWIYYQKRSYVEVEKEKKWQLNLQFKELLVGMSSALVAGYSVENSITEARISLQCMYHEESLLLSQVKQMEHQLQMNETIESVFAQFADRSDLEDVQNFAWILVTAKRTGGDLIRITQHTSDTISQKIDIDREIQTTIAAKKYESSIMNVIPLGILVYLKVCSPGFLDPLYQDMRGHLMMTVILVLYLAALQLSRYLMDIKV